MIPIFSDSQGAIRVRLDGDELPEMHVQSTDDHRVMIVEMQDIACVYVRNDHGSYDRARHLPSLLPHWTPGKPLALYSDERNTWITED